MNPFAHGDPLIEPSAENTRIRICSFEEEEKLLSFCTGRREHLRAIIILAIDTFLRRNELLTLTGSNIDLDARCLTVTEYNAKTQKERIVPLSERAHQAFVTLRGDKPIEQWDASPVFDTQSVKSSWYGVLRAAKIIGLRFHDLRATGITRMLDAGVPAATVMRYSGHDQYETFMKYVRNDLRTMADAADAMTAYYEKRRAEIDAP